MHIFLILNYNSAEYINSLLKQIPNSYPIVIVDNCSKQADLQLLEQYINGYHNVELIKLEKNLGFAQGNNVGFNYIKKNYSNVDAIHCINPDIEFVNFDQLINHINENLNDNAIIAPNILTNNYNSSPMFIRDINTIKQDVKNELQKYKQKIIKHKCAKLLGNYYEKYLIKNQSYVLNYDFDVYKKELSKSQYFVYHGCYLVFTKNFIDKYDQLFNPKTFLYHEEDFLFYKMFKDQQQVKFLENDFIKHLENPLSRKDLVKTYSFLLASEKEFYKEIKHE